METQYDTRKSFNQFHSDEIRSGLECVRTAMLLGEITKNKFNMNTVLTTSDEEPCGTVACIGGWLATFLRIDPEAIPNAVTELVDPSDERLPPEDKHQLASLFWEYPVEPDRRDRLLPFEGVEAITAWLNGDRTTPWEKVAQRIYEAEFDPVVKEQLLALENGSKSNV